jgi:hypothetical protein
MTALQGTTLPQAWFRAPRVRSYSLMCTTQVKRCLAQRRHAVSLLRGLPASKMEFSQRTLDEWDRMPDFPAAKIPPADMNPSVHAATRWRQISSPCMTLIQCDVSSQLRRGICTPHRQAPCMQSIPLLRFTHGIYTGPSMSYPQPAEPSAHMAMAVLDSANTIPCPYRHISAVALPPPTTPQMTVLLAP